MKNHNFLISTTRPELLAEQIRSFSKHKDSRQVSFYVFNDRDEKSDQFESTINHLREKLPEIQIFYFSLNEQINILRSTASKYSSVLGVNAEEILNCFRENEKLQGIRSIQNKSVFIFYLENKDRGSIVHKVDDDVFPYEAHRNGDQVKIHIKDNFYQQKEESVGNNISIISGSNYTIDSPSPLVNYADFMEFLCNFYTIAKQRESTDQIGTDMLKISPAKVSEVADPLGLLQILPISSSLTYHDALHFLEKHIEVFKNGSSRLIINDNEEETGGVNTFFPGGCVSFLHGNLPTLTPLFGNQDLLWGLFESIDGKILLTDGYIGHRKSLNNRPSIIDDLKDSSYKHQTRITYSIFEYLKEYHKSINSLHNFQRNFIEPMNKWLQESKAYTEEVTRLLKQETNWYADESKYPSTPEIKDLCSAFLDSYQNIESNFSVSSLNVTLLIDDYLRKKSIFDSLLKEVYIR